MFVLIGHPVYFHVSISIGNKKKLLHFFLGEKSVNVIKVVENARCFVKNYHQMVLHLNCGTVTNFIVKNIVRFTNVT